MHAVLEHYNAILGGAGVLVSVAMLAYRFGQWRSASRISLRLKTDRDFSIAILEELAARWGAKLERHEGPPGSA